MVSTGKFMGHLLALLLLVAIGSVLFAQEARPLDQDEPVRLKADLVTISASVFDKQGRALKTLDAADFVVYEDGVEQKIAHFASTEEPFTLLLLLDISGSTREEIDLIKRAANGFVNQLSLEDRVGVVLFSSEVELIADIKDSRNRVEAAISGIAAAEGTAEFRYTPKTGTSFYDALFLAVDESPLRNVDGRKAIVCMSDGVDSTSKLDYKDIAKPVEFSEASVYFLELNTHEAMLTGLVKPQGDPGYINFSQSQIDRYYNAFDSNSPDRFRPRHLITPLIRREIAAGLYDLAGRELRELAERTGGRAYPVRSLTDLSAVYKQVADDLRSQYSIGYYPSNDSRDGRWRSIRVEARKAARVQARPGYWASEK